MKLLSFYQNQVHGSYLASAAQSPAPRKAHPLLRGGAALLTAALLSAGSIVPAYAAAGTGGNGASSASGGTTQNADVPDAWKSQISSADINRIPVAANTDRLLLVEGYGTQCRVSLYVRDMSKTHVQSPTASTGGWTLMLSTNGALGRNGIGKEKEGDGKTPQGIFSISPFAFGNADAPENSALPYHKVTKNDYWCGDSSSPYYDQLVDITKTGAVFNAKASEHLIDYGRYYNYCLNIEYNQNHTPGKGSALFLHCNSHDGSVETTSGCVSINQDVMKTILANVSAHTQILIDTAGNIPDYYTGS